MLRCDKNKRDGLWGKLLAFYESKGCLVDAKLFPRRRDEVAFRQYKASTYIPLSYTTGLVGDVMPNPDNAVLAPRFERAMKREY